METVFAKPIISIIKIAHIATIITVVRASTVPPSKNMTRWFWNRWSGWTDSVSAAGKPAVSVNS